MYLSAVAEAAAVAICENFVQVESKLGPSPYGPP